MTIQVSVVIWTIICFVMLMLILHFLFFKPILQIMDKRQERIDTAARKKAERIELVQEQEAERHRQEMQEYEKREKKLREELERFRMESKRAIEEANTERLQGLENYRIQTEAEHAGIMEELNRNSETLAISFTESIIRE